MPSPLLASLHAGRALEPHDLWSAWSFEPVVLITLVAWSWCYTRGVRVVWARAGREHGVRRSQVAYFAAGIATLFIALVSPLDPLGEALFSAHMVQHLLLALVAAPLIALGAPVVGTLWGLPREKRRAIARWWGRSTRIRPTIDTLLHPLAAWLLAAFALWIWHTPYYYDSAVRHEPIHALEHASFFATSLLFWWVLVRPAGLVRRGQGVGMLYLFAAAMQSGMLGALLTFSTGPWYAAHLATTRAWGLTPLQDQQIAGAIMWLPASLIYLAGMSLMFLLWVRAAERRAQQRAARRIAATVSS